MIAHLSGTVFKKEPRALIVDVQGVGYRVFCTLELLAQSAVGQKTALHIHQHIREDDVSLFGFAKEDELNFFEKLISVSGIGPKTALEILAVPARLIGSAITNGDVPFLQSLKGIGRKTAERLIVELRGSLPTFDAGSGVIVPAEVVAALSDLGFESGEIQRAFQELKEPLKKSEEMVKWFLQRSAA